MDPQGVAEDPAVLHEAGEHPSSTSRHCEPLALGVAEIRLELVVGRRRSARRRGRGTRRTPRSGVPAVARSQSSSTTGRRRARGCRRAGRRAASVRGPARLERVGERRGIRDRAQDLVGRRLRARNRRRRPRPPRAASAAGRARRAPTRRPAATTSRGGRRARRALGNVAGEGGVHRRGGLQDPPALGAREPALIAKERGREIAHHHPPAVAIGDARTRCRGRVQRACARTRRPPQQRRTAAVAGNAAEPVGTGPDPLGDQPGPVVEHDPLERCAGVTAVLKRPGRAPGPRRSSTRPGARRRPRRAAGGVAAEALDRPPSVRRYQRRRSTPRGPRHSK